MQAGRELAKAAVKHIGLPAGLDEEKYAKVKKAVERGLSVAETVTLMGISISSVNDTENRSKDEIHQTIDRPE